LSSTANAAVTIGSGAAAGALAGPIGAGIGAATAAIKVGIAELAAHTAQLQDAANENAALDQLIPAFDADLKSIAAAFNAGEADADTCISACYQVDTNAFNYLRAQVGKAGTAWGGPTTNGIGADINPTYSAACDKTCTAGCCVYLNDLRPAIYGRSVPLTSYTPYQTLPGIVGGLIAALTSGSGMVKVIPVAAPPNKAYGNYQRASYTLYISAPPASADDYGTLALSGSGKNLAVTPAPAPATSVLSSGILSTLTSNETVAIIGVLGGLLLIITTLFGANALRVNK
jgi:hypothetical protein